jgi:hypothetical protein
MKSWRVSHQHASRIDTHCIPFTTARWKKERYRLTKRVCAHDATRCSIIARSKLKLIARISGTQRWFARASEKLKNAR